MASEQALSTTQKIAQLKVYAKSVKEGLYHRVVLASQILSDDEWMRETFSGNKTNAEEYLRQQGFPLMTLTVGQLAEIYSKWPTELAWKNWDYDVMRMFAEIERRKGPSLKRAPGTNWKVEAERLKVELKDLAEKYACLERANAEMAGELKGIKETMQGSLQGSLAAA